jgi:hypothetical protein
MGVSPLGEESILFFDGVHQVAHAYRLRWEIEGQSRGGPNEKDLAIVSLCNVHY